MTTANLSVGIKTERAKESLRELKAWMAKDMVVSVGLDPTSIDRSINAYFKQRTFKVKVNTKDLASEVGNDLERAIDAKFQKTTRTLGWNQAALVGQMEQSIKSVMDQKKRRLSFDREGLQRDINSSVVGVFDRTHRVNIDEMAIAAQVKAGVEMGLKGAKLNLGVAGGAAPTVPTDQLVNAVRMAMMPMAEEIGKASALMAGTARKVAAESSGGATKTRASVGASSKLEDGRTLKYSTSLDPEDVEGAKTLVSQGIANKKRQDQLVAHNKVMNDLADKNSKDRLQMSAEEIKKQAEIDKAWSLRDKVNQGPSKDSAFKAAEAELASSLNTRQKLEKDHTQKLKDEIRARLKANKEAESIGVDSAKDYFKAQEAALKEFKARQRQSISDGKFEVSSSRSDEAARNATWDKLEKQQKKSREDAWKQVEEENAASLNTRAKLEKSHTDKLKEEIKARLQANKEAQAQGLDSAKAFFSAQEQAIKSFKSKAAEQQKQSISDGKFEIKSSSADQAARDAAWSKMDKQQRDSKSNAWQTAEAERERQLSSIVAAENARRRAENTETTKQAIAQIREHEAALKEADESRRNRINRVQTLARKAAEEEDKNEKLELARRYEKYKLDAAKRFQGAGVNAAAAQRLASDSDVGPEKARQFLGKKDSLLDVSLTDYARKAKEGTTNSKELNAAVNELRSGFRGLAGSMGAMWLTWGSIIPLAAGAAIGGMFMRVLSVGKDLEYQLGFVSILTNDAAIGVDRFGEKIKGSQTGVVDGAKALRALAQNGLNAKESLMALPDILNLAIAGEMGLSEAALGATGVMSAFNLKVTDLGRVSDVFAKSAALSNTDVASMVEAMKQASTVSDQYKVSLEETSASLAVMAKRNITGSAAGTAFRNMMTELATPTKKAREALKQMGVELYDANNQLKTFPEVLSQLRDATTSLNEKGRLTFLREIFDERGAKSANALLSDYGLLNEIIGKLKNSSEGFTASVVQALGETTSGKVKRLTTDFELLSAKAFEASSNSLKNLIDAVRSDIGSQGFTDFVKNATSGAATFAKMVYECTGAVTTLSVGLLALRVSGLASVSWLAAASIPATLFLAALGGLAYAYLKVTSATNDNVEAVKAKTNALKAARESSEQESKSIQEKLTVLYEENRLYLAGATAIDAKRQAQEKMDEAKLRTLKGSKSDIQSRVAALDVEINKPSESLLSEKGLTNNVKDLFKKNQLKAEKAALLEQLKELDAQEKSAMDASVSRRLSTYASSRNKLLEGITEYNKAAAELNKTAKFKDKPLEIFNTASLNRADDSVIKMTLDRLNEAKEKRLGSYAPPNPDARAADNAETRALLSRLDEEQARLKALTQLRNKLDEARYPTDSFGKGGAAVISETRAMQDQVDSLKQQEELIAKIEAVKAKGNLKAPDITMLNERIAKEQRSLENAREDLKIRQQIADLNLNNARYKDQKDFDVSLAKLSGEDRIGLEKLKKPEEKAKPAVDQVRDAAQLAVQQRYADKISEKQAETAAIYERLNALKESYIFLEGKEYDAAERAIAVLETDLSLNQARLLILEAQASSSAKVAGNTAARQYEASQTAGYGWDKFWEEYKSKAESSAQQVESIMKTTTDSMTAGFTRFLTTGKFGFKDFAASVATEATKLLATKGIMQLLGLASNYFGVGSFSSGSYYADGSANGGIVGTSTNFADGGVMTAYGRMPLRKYDAGGVGRSPQVSIHSEWTKPEAYVPLQDGRTIPVTVSGGQGGGNCQVSVSVHIDGNGNSQVESDASGQKAKQLGDMVGGLVTEKLLMEQRPGGILYRG